MVSPFRFYYPPSVCGVTTTVSIVPAGYDHPIPFAHSTLTRCDLGNFIIQSVPGDDYLIELRSFSLIQDGYIELITDEPCVTVAMFLKGDARCLLAGEVILKLAAKSYLMIYLPKGRQRIEMNKGNYVWFCIVPPIYYLKSMAAEDIQFNELNRRLQEQEADALSLKTLPLPYAILRIIKRLERTHKKGAALDFDLRRYMLEILNLYHEQYSQQKLQPIPYTTLRDKAIASKEYILRHLGDVSLGGLNEMALRFYASTKSLNKEFKLITGKTIPQFITDQRMHWAKDLLAKKDLPVFEIALITGYSDTSNFIRTFRRCFGYSPRRQNRKGSKK